MVTGWCFVDFNIKIDTINRNMLFYKFQKYGIVGNLYNVIKSLYSEFLYTVKYDNSLSIYFLKTVGLKQGCPLSPVLSYIYFKMICTKYFMIHVFLFHFGILNLLPFHGLMMWYYDHQPLKVFKIGWTI